MVRPRERLASTPKRTRANHAQPPKVADHAQPPKVADHAQPPKVADHAQTPEGTIPVSILRLVSCRGRIGVESPLNSCYNQQAFQ